MDPLHIELAALSRLSVDLNRLGGSLKRISETPSMAAPADATVDTPSVVAARLVSSVTIPRLQGTVGDRFLDVGYLVDQARNWFKDADDNRAKEITRAGFAPPSSALTNEGFSSSTNAPLPKERP